MLSRLNSKVHRTNNKSSAAEKLPFALSLFGKLPRHPLEGRAYMKTMDAIDPEGSPESFKLAVNELCLRRETNVEN